jgi:hypothetical protein
MLSEPGPVHEKILESPEVLSKLFQFLDHKSLNATLAGYFSKVAISLITKNPDKAVNYFCNYQVIPKLITHLYSRSIVDIVLKILTFDNSQIDFFTKERKKIVEMVVLSLFNADGYNVYFSGIILSEILNRAMEINSWKDLIQVIISSDNLRQYFELLIGSDTFKSLAAGNLIKNLISLLGRIQLYTYFQDFNYTDILKLYLPSLLQSLAHSSESRLTSTNTQQFEPLGEKRLRIIEIISLSLKIDHEKISPTIIESGILAEIITLFFKNHLNSILHNVVDDLVITCISIQDPSLTESILIHSGLLNKLTSLALSPETVHKEGIIGYVNKIGNYLKSNENIIKNLLDQVPDWELFLKSYLESRNALDSFKLGDNQKKNSYYETETTVSYSQTDFSHETQETIDQDTEMTEESSKAGNFEHNLPEVFENKISEVSLTENYVNTLANNDTAPNPPENIDKKTHSINLEDLNHNPGTIYRTYSPRSPVNPDFHGVTYWSIPAKVDEIDDLED